MGYGTLAAPAGSGANQRGKKMKSIGGLMFVLGLGSFLLHYLGMEFKLLMWIDSWGPTTGTAIRIGLVVVGAVLWLVAGRQEKAVAAE